MYCQNCGKEIQEGVKFCPGCGSPTGFALSAQEDSKPITGSPESVADVGSAETEKAEIIQEESTAAEIEKAVETPVQAEGVTHGQPANSAPQSVIESASAPVYNYDATPIQKTSGQESFTLSQNGQIKNGKIKFKDLPPKKKALRLGIGGLLLLIGIILIFSDGGKKATRLIEYDCDNGAVFSITLDDFIEQANKSHKTVFGYKTDISGNFGSPSTNQREDSGCPYVLYSAFFDNVNVCVKVIDGYVAGIVVLPDYEQELDVEQLANVMMWISYTIGDLSISETKELYQELINGVDQFSEYSVAKNNVNYTLRYDGLGGFTVNIEPDL